MRRTTLIAVCVVMLGCQSPSVYSQVLNLFDVSDDATSVTNFFNGQFISEARDAWTGSFNLGVTGTTSGGSSLPNPGNEASGSGAFFADHQFGLTSWALTGSATGSIDAGLGNLGTPFPTIANTTTVGGGFSFFVDEPFTLSLIGEVFETFEGESSITGTSNGNQATVRLLAIILDGILVNEYLASWESNSSAGGTYVGSFGSGVFRLETFAGAVLSSNVQDASGTQFSSYNAQLSVMPIPEPSGLLLVGVAGWLGLRRRRGRRSV